LLLTDAIKTGQTEHIIYFLLSAYVETLEYYDPPRSSLPSCVNRLPIAGTRDVTGRLRALRETLDSNVQDGQEIRALVQEAVDVFATASHRLRLLEDSDQSVKSWNVVERGAHGPEKRRRLVLRMTQRQAREWADAHDTHLECAEESTS